MQDPSLYSQIKAQVQSQPQFQEQEHLKCPRCDSTNTKFCYYNNYNLSQPRHFCKNCRRYWTKGGSLRNIPVGGGSRKNSKRSSSSSASSTTTKRPAAAAPPPNAKNESKSSNGGMSEEALPLKGESFVGQFGNLLEVGGSLSFSSLLGSNGGQFGNILDGLGPNGSSLELEMTDHFGDPGSGQNVGPDNGDGFLSIHGGDSGGGDGGCWTGGSNGWPDLAMSTPESTFM